jgi:hypothetical protein
MLQQRYTMDYGSRKAGSRPTLATDEYHPLFFLDMIIIVGRPMKSLTRASDRFFDNTTLSFRHWSSSYSCKHIHGFSFDLGHRTFRLATAATRESWFIVMHPTGTTMAELPSSRREQRQKAEEASKSSALEYPHAQFLTGYIKELFLSNDLLGEGLRLRGSWMGRRRRTSRSTSGRRFKKCSWKIGPIISETTPRMASGTRTNRPSTLTITAPTLKSKLMTT